MALSAAPFEYGKDTPKFLQEDYSIGRR